MVVLYVKFTFYAKPKNNVSLVSAFTDFGDFEIFLFFLFAP